MSTDDINNSTIETIKLGSGSFSLAYTDDRSDTQDTPQPLSAAERVMGVLGWVIALSIILSIAAIVFVVNRQQRKKQCETDSDSARSSPARKKKPADDFQNQGQIYDELPNPADYVSYHLACNKDGFPEQHSPPVQPPLTFLPQHPCTQSNTFTYPTPSGPNTSYTFPKEH